MATLYKEIRTSYLTRGFAFNTPLLEFGPLDKPLLKKSDCPVFYLDYTDLASLQKLYQNEKDVQVAEICAPDFVLDGSRLAQLTKGTLFQGVVASHVIEHVPNLVGWLQEISEILEEGGILNLAIPDKRFIFDHHRQLSSITDLVEAHLQNYKRPSLRHVFDQNAFYHHQSTYSFWRHGAEPVLNPSERLKYAYEQAQLWLQSEQYMNGHCWVFTPDSFLQALLGLVELGLTDFELVNFQPTALGQGEFFVSLKKLNSTLSAEEKKGQQREALARFGCPLSTLNRPLKTPTAPNRMLFLGKAILEKLTAKLK